MAANLISTGLSGDIRNTGLPCFEVTCSHLNTPRGAMFSTDNGFTVSERFDQGADFSTATGLFTAPVTGRYLACIDIRIDSVIDTTYIHVGLVTSNVDRHSLAITQSLNRSYEHMSVSYITDMDAADTAYCKSYTAGSTFTTDTQGESSFSMVLIC